MAVSPYFEVKEADQDGEVRLSLHGELDRASTPVLEDRLSRLRAKRRSVRLDLSELEFIDSTGLHLLIRATGDARMDGWELRIEPELSPTVRRLFKLCRFDPFNQAAEPRRRDPEPTG
jgi:anti-anti-sigma factor